MSFMHLSPLFSGGVTHKLTDLQGHYSYVWSSVSIGSGGYVNGVFLHPSQPEQVYFATNVGGLFRWDAAHEQSTPLTDRFTLNQRHFYAINGVALHPTDPPILYVATGNLANKKTGQPGAIFKSLDLGGSWRQVTPKDWPVKVGGMNYPWVIQRLVIDPHAPDILLYGSNVDGLWRSTDAGETWSHVSTIEGVSHLRSANSFADESLTGIMTIVFDPHIVGRVYAGAYGDGVYRSDDSGATWARIPNSPQKAFQMAVADDGALWVTSRPGKPKFGVHVYAAGCWRSFNPSGKAGGYNALAVNPLNADEVLVATWWRKGPFSHEHLYRTVDGGKSWAQVAWTVNHIQPWLPDEDCTSTIASLAYDPSVPGRVWLTGGYSVYRTEDINMQSVQWTPLNKNIESTVVFDLTELQDGQLVSAIADVSGFVHENGLEAYPSRRLVDGDKNLSKAIYTYSLAHTQQTTPQKVVRVASQFKGFFSGVLTSTDRGATWLAVKKSFSIPFIGKGYPFQVAIAPGDAENLVVTRVKALAHYSRNGGKNWHTVKGLPKGIDCAGAPFTIYARPLAADGALDETFYYYHAETVYRSQDGGRTFAAVNTSLPVQSSSGFYSIKAVPGKAQELWLNLETAGLYHSTDGGITWTTLTNIKEARLLAIGKAAPGADVSVLYLYGTIDDVSDAIFCSTDGGETWKDIQDQAIPIGCNPTVMEASTTLFGLVYIGTAGRGVYYGRPGDALRGEKEGSFAP